MFKLPSDKQIDLANEIAYALSIDFPQSSRDFTAKDYWDFINKHIQEYYDIVYKNKTDPDDYYDNCENDVWGEYY